MPVTLSGVTLSGAATNAFTPMSLFAAGEQGAFYDPSDLNTLFEDSAGTIPVTGVEKSVGLMLDKSKGLVPGPELVNIAALPTPTINDAGGSTGTWTAGTRTIANTTLSTLPTYPRFAFDFGLVAGARYAVIGQLTGDITAIAGIRLATSGTANGLAYNSSTGVFSGYTEAAASIIEFQINGTLAVPKSVSIASLSIRLIPGNHAFQSVSGSRPLLSARVNLLEKTEQFNDAYWGKASSGTGVVPVVTANAGVAPDGTQTADLIVFDRGAGNTLSDTSQISSSTVSVVTNIAYLGSVYLKAGSVSDIGKQIAIRHVGGGAYTVVTLTDQWQRVSSTETPSVTPRSLDLVSRGGITTSNQVSVLVWGADLRVANDTTLKPYQRVDTSTSYDTVGFPFYLQFQTDDSFLTNSVDFTGTDKMTVWAGVRKLSDASVGILVELSSNTNLNAGSFVNGAPAAAGTYDSWSRGTASGAANQVSTASGYAAPITNVLSSSHDISGDLTTLRVNTVAASPATGDQGTGNFGNYPLYIGRRNNATLPYNGRIYSLIIRGAQSTATEISETETYVNSKTLAY